MTADGAWPTAAVAPAAFVEQWGAGGVAQTDFTLAPPLQPRPSSAFAFATAPMAADIPGRRTAVNAGSRRGVRAGVAVASLPFYAQPDLVRLPTGVLIPPAVGSPMKGRKRVGGGERRADCQITNIGGPIQVVNHALVDHLTYTEMGLTCAGITSLEKSALSPLRGSKSAAAVSHASLQRSSDGYMASLEPLAQPVIELVVGQGRVRGGGSRELKGDAARELLTAPPPVRIVEKFNAKWRAEALAPEVTARFTTQTRESFTGKMEGGPAVQPLRRRGLAAPPASIVGTAAFPTRLTCIY